MSKMLTGALEITRRMGVSEASFIDLVNQKGLPAKKNDDNVFEISAADLEKWEKRSAAEKPEPEESLKAPKLSSRKKKGGRAR